MALVVCVCVNFGAVRLSDEWNLVCKIIETGFISREPWELDESLSQTQVWHRLRYFFILYLLAHHCWSLDPNKQLLCTWVVKGMESVEFWKKLDCPRTTENWRDIESNPGWTLAPPFLCRTCMLAPALLACFLALLIAEIKGRDGGSVHFRDIHYFVA